VTRRFTASARYVLNVSMMSTWALVVVQLSQATANSAPNAPGRREFFIVVFQRERLDSLYDARPMLNAQ
jgi:hypothetical protein